MSFICNMNFVFQRINKKGFLLKIYCIGNINMLISPYLVIVTIIIVSFFVGRLQIKMQKFFDERKS
jgi:hypothetical protein